jgi:hypothetical protein
VTKVKIIFKRIYIFTIKTLFEPKKSLEYVKIPII